MSVTRNRLTWKNRTAAEAPAIPGAAETVDADMSKVVKGGPSEFGEDVHKGPYTQSPAPALPGYEELQAAMDSGLVPQMSEEEIIAVEKKASKCLRIAKTMLGKTASEASVEAQALDLMDLPDNQIEATLARVASTFLTAGGEGEGEVAGSKVGMDALAEKLEMACGKVADACAAMEGMTKAIKEAGGWSAAGEQAKTASFGKTAEEMLAEMLLDEAAPVAKTASMSKTAEDMLAEMLLEEMTKEAAEGEKAEEAAPAEGEQTEEAKLPGSVSGLAKALSLSDEQKSMLEEFMKAQKEKIEEKVEKKMEKAEEAAPAAEEVPAEEAPAEEAGEKEASLSMEAEEAHLGLDSDDGMRDASDVLAKLFGEGAPEAPTHEAEETPAPVKTASLRPQPRKPSEGAKSLGAVTKVASDEVDDLSKLWESAPDVSDVFNSSKW